MAIPTVPNFDIKKIPYEGSPTFRSDAGYVWSFLPKVIDAQNESIDGINKTASTISSQALQVAEDRNLAQQAALTAQAIANFKGVWDGATLYTSPSSVVCNGVFYISLQDSINKDPTTATAYWSVIKDQGNTIHANSSGLPNELSVANAGSTFKIADAVNDDEAVSKGQLDLKAIGVNQQWITETANKELEKTYINTSLSPIFIEVFIEIGYLPGEVYSYVNGVMIGIYRSSIVSSGDIKEVINLSAIIPPLATYSLTANGTCSILLWVELK